MKTIKQIKIFVSCPSDIKEEIDSITLIVNEINKTSGKQNGYTLDILNWKYDTYTDIGSDAQEVINDQLENQYDILIGLLWTKAGTPTTRDKSGTIEEINRAITNLSKEQLIYFRTSPPGNIYDIDLNQLEILKQFKSDLSKSGVLYKDYNSIDSFETLFRINITNLILDKIINQPEVKAPSVSILNEKYSDIYNLISEIESKDNNDFDIFDLLQEGTSYLNNVTFSLSSLSNSLNFFAEIVNGRTSEINKHNNIKDVKLKNNKIIHSVNHLAEELLEFNKRIDDEVPIFSENFKLSAKAYSQIILVLPKKSTDVIELKANIRILRDSVKYALDENAKFLKTVMTLPLINSKFNNSKRQTEVTIKNLIKEILNGLELLDELLDDEPKHN